MDQQINEMSHDKFLDELEQLLERSSGVYVVALDGSKFEMRSFNLDFNTALVVQYLTEQFVDSKFVELQSQGQKGN